MAELKTKSVNAEKTGLLNNPKEVSTKTIPDTSKQNTISEQSNHQRVGTDSSVLDVIMIE